MRGRITSETRVINGQTFTTQWAYNSADQVTQMLYPDGEYLTFSYLPQGGVNRIGAYLTGTKVNANGQISLRTFGNGTQISLTYGDWLNNGGRLSGLQSGQPASLLNLEFTYDSVGNILTITDQLNSSQVQTFGYDALNRLISASTNGVGEGQYSQSYSYDPATGNLASKSDVGAYTYSSAKPHAVTSAGPSAYTYDANGNMISRNGQPISYDAENHLTAFAGKTYLYDGDGKRVAEINADGTATIFIGNYFEGAYPEPEPPPQPPQPLKFYMPFVSNAEEATDLFEPITARMGILYFYADGQRIAMKKDGVVSCIYGDQLGSVSAVADASGNLISEALYHPWGTTRYAQGASPTDYGYTGQMKEGDIYFYNARWYDPQLGRFMQADTFVPTVQGTQGFDRYAYVNNNPMRYIDPSGNSAVSEYLEGVALEFLSDMTYGAFDSLITNKSDSEHFQDGRYLGKGLAQALNCIEIVGGGFVMAGSFTLISGTGGLSLAVAGPTGGGSIAIGVPAIAVEAVPLISGFALSAHGATSLMYSMNRKIDSIPTITRKGMLGQNGTHTPSTNVWQGKRGRLDVENPNPGIRPGNIHFQPWDSDLKFYYDPYSNAFLPSGENPVPRYLKDLLSSDVSFIRGIIKGLKYLGEIK